MEKITSNQNSRVKDWKKMQTKKGRVKSGQYVIEGWHIVDEAIRHRQTIKELMVVDESYLGALPVDDTTQVFIITPEIAKHISSTETPQGVFAVLDTQDYHEKIPDELQGAWLLLDNIQIPATSAPWSGQPTRPALTELYLVRGLLISIIPKLSVQCKAANFI